MNVKSAFLTNHPDFHLCVMNSPTDFEFPFMSYGNTGTIININYSFHNFIMPEWLAIPSICRKQAA